MIVNRKCIKPDLFAIIMLALLDLPKKTKQLSEISFKNNLQDRNILNLYTTTILVINKTSTNQTATYCTTLLLRILFTFNSNNNFSFNII